MLAARTVLRTQAQLSAAARVNTVARALSTSSVAYDAKQRADSMQRVTVFGAGLMGAGIAQVSAQAGLKVTLTDVTDKALENGINIIKKSVARVAKKKQPDDIEGFTNKVLQNISTSTDAGAAVADTDLVVEAILENLKVKQDLFAFLDSKAKKETIFASNTSSLSIGEIAEKCSEERQTQFAGLHFFNRESHSDPGERVDTRKSAAGKTRYRGLRAAPEWAAVSHNPHQRPCMEGPYQ